MQAAKSVLQVETVLEPNLLPNLQPTDEPLLKIMREHFGLENFRKGQADILASVMAGHDTLAVMPTGGGKSLCYQLPALAFPSWVIVISPLIALMRDQVEGLRRLGLNAGTLHSHQSMDEKRAVFKALAESESYVLYVSPERVQSERFAEWFLSQKKVRLIAIDESHCISQWGPDFRVDYHRLNRLRELRPDIPILALTATATPPVLIDIEKQLSLKDARRHIYGFYRPNLYFQVEDCSDADAKMGWLRQCLSQVQSGRILVYCGTRKQSEELADTLGRDVEGVGTYHAGLSAEKRHEIQSQFGSGKLRILFATNAFGMGVDHPDVRLVVHYQMPANIESLYQEMGRAGRDGAPSTCLLLYSKRDKGLHSYFIQSSDAEADIIRARWRALEMLTRFAETSECRQSGILTYFRDSQRIKNCGHCDVCDPSSARKIQMPTWTQSLKKLVKSSRSKSKKKVDSTALDEAGQLRFEVLKVWRRAYAEAHDVPAFVVMSNRSLEALSAKNPQTLAELEEVHGFGPYKVEKLGTEILAELKKCL